MKAIVSIIIVIVIFIVSQTASVSAFSVREILGLDKAEKQEEVPDGKDSSTNKKEKVEWAATSTDASEINPQLDLKRVEMLVANMKPAERQAVLADDKLFKQAIENEAVNRSVLSAAIANNMDKDSNVEFLMQRGAENILREAYLNRLILSKLPTDFPTAQQVEEYFENNKSQFVIPDRTHVWQIFFKKPEGADGVKKAKADADKAYKKLKKKATIFSELAIEQSEHEPSRANGGYMGLIKTDEMIPEIKTNLAKLKEGEISQPIESDSGFHILKKGATIQSTQVELAQVEQQIRQLLVKQANIQLRQAIFAQASKEFPQSITDTKIEEWRLRLKTDTVSSQ